MKPLPRMIWIAGAVLLVGALLSFFILGKTDSAPRAIVAGYFYSVCLFGTFGLVRRFFTARLSVFSTAQQVLLRTLLYASALGVAYLLGLVFQTIILIPAHTWKLAIAEQLRLGFLHLISFPFTGESFDSLLTGEVRTVLTGFFTGIFLIGLVSVLGSYIEMRWQQNVRRQAVQQAELSALRAQIEPHFLFNSLNTIVAILRSDTERAEKLLLQLSDILRYMFQNSQREKVDLQQEIEFTKQYVELLQARFGEKLVIKWSVSASPKELSVPGLIMQPLIENAIRHGWVDRNQPLHLHFSVNRNAAYVVMSVSDDGAGISAQRLQQLPLPGHALENISTRLALFFGQKKLLSIVPVPDSGTRVDIKIPLQTL